MALTKLTTITEIATASVLHGTAGYVGTNLGNVYRMVAATGAMTLLTGVNAKIVSMVLNHPTLYFTTSKGEVYAYDITVTDDKYAPLAVGANANAAGSGVPISAAQTAGFRIYADDGGASLAAGSYRAGVVRMLLATAKATTGVDVTVSGLQAQTKVVADVKAYTGYLSGLWGYMELAATANVLYATGVRATVDLATGGIVTTNGVISALMLDSIDLTGTHTGVATMIHAPNPLAGTWDYFAVFGSAPGAVTASTEAAQASTFKIKIRIGSTVAYIAAMASGT